MQRILLAYSGDLETTVAIPWLRDTCAAEIIAVTLDLGQGRELEAVRDRALAAGAVRAHVLDAREEFAQDYILPALAADAVAGERWPIAAAIEAPLIARKLMDIAGIERAGAIAHGGRARGPLQVALRTLQADVSIVTPADTWELNRPEQIVYARQRGVPLPAAFELPWRVNATLWGRFIAGGPLDDLSKEPPADLYTLTKSPADCPDHPAYVEIGFARGRPGAINGVDMPLVELVGSLTTIAGVHGVGRIDRVENRKDGTTSRSIGEAPAAVVLHQAHEELQKLVTPSETERFGRHVSRQYAEIIADGLWFSHLREALDAYVEQIQARVNGAIRMKLWKGDCRIVGRQPADAPRDRRGAGRLMVHQ